MSALRQCLLLYALATVSRSVRAARFLAAWLRRSGMRVLFLLCLLTPAFAAPAYAAKPVPKKKLARRRAKLVSYRKWLAMTVSWRDVVNTKVRRKLLSGLPTVIVTRAYVFVEGRDKPLALSIKTCRVVFDLWDEVFRIELRYGGRKQTTVAVNVEGVLRRCAEARRMAITSMKTLAAKKPHFVAVLVEVNPLSKKMMARIRRWVSRPRGAGQVARGDSLFGSFVGLFITQLPEADRVLSFRTQTFIPKKVRVQKPKKKPRRRRKPARRPKQS